MKLFRWAKDGGPESHVHGFFLCEFKSLFSIVLLRFSDGSREAYHSHAFNSVSWVLRGRLREHLLRTKVCHTVYAASIWPVLTMRQTFHKVVSEGTTWVLSIRGPWAKTWREYIPRTGDMLTLSNHRVQL